MEQSYKIIAPDGREYGPVNAETIKLWFSERRIGEDNMVFDCQENRWTRLAQAFNLQDWNASGQKSQLSLPAETQKIAHSPDFVIKMLPATESRPGLRLAAWLILIDGLVGYAYLVFEQSSVAKTGSPSTVGLIFSVLIFIGLIRKKGFLNRPQDSWRIAAIARIALGLLVYCAIVPLSEQSLTGYVTAGVALVELLAILSLLIGPPPSGLRIKLSLAVLALLILGSLIYPFAAAYIGAITANQEQAQNIKKLALPGREYSEDQRGVKLSLPDGWVLLPKDNPFFSPPGANSILADPNIGVFATIIVEALTVRSLPDGPTPTDRYLNLVIKNRQKSVPLLQEVSRKPIDLCHEGGIRVITSWTENNEQFNGISAACREGFNFYLISAVCSGKNFSQALSAFQSIEHNLKITKDKETQIAELAQQTVQNVSYFTGDAAKLIIREILARDLEPSDASQFGFDSVQRGQARLTANEQQELQAIQRQLAKNLTASEIELYNSVYKKRQSRIRVSEKENQETYNIIKRAYERLPENDFERYRTLISKAVMLELENSR